MTIIIAHWGLIGAIIYYRYLCYFNPEFIHDRFIMAPTPYRCHTINFQNNIELGIGSISRVRKKSEALSLNCNDNYLVYFQFKAHSEKDKIERTSFLKN